MSRALDTLRAAVWWAALAAVGLWLLPSIAVALARWWGSWLRFEATMCLGRALVAVGLPEVARWVYAAEIARAERGMQAIEGWRGWRGW